MSKRKRGRPRKAGNRTASGRLTPAVDHGTHELQRHRQHLVGENGDPVLSTTAAGRLFARDLLKRPQFEAAERYRALRCALYGPPWPSNGVPMTDQISETRLLRLQWDFDQMVRALVEDQRVVIAQFCVFDDDRIGFEQLKVLQDGLTTLANLEYRPFRPPTSFPKLPQIGIAPY